MVDNLWGRAMKQGSRQLFYWKTPKMTKDDREQSRKQTEAMHRLGRKRFLELFDVVFNGAIMLTVPRDTSKVTLADLEKMWSSKMVIIKVFPEWNKPPVWSVDGNNDTVKLPSNTQRLSAGYSKKRMQAGLRGPTDCEMRRSMKKLYGEELLRIYEWVFGRIYFVPGADLPYKRRIDNYSCECLMKALKFMRDEYPKYRQEQEDEKRKLGKTISQTRKKRGEKHEEKS